jgi:hypothetical protein
MVVMSKISIDFYKDITLKKDVTVEIKQHLLNDINILINKYKNHIATSELVELAITYILQALKIDNYVRTEYLEIYPALFIQYAQTNLNPMGFYGKYLIDYSINDTWIKRYPEWKKTIALIPHITSHLLNESLSSVFAHAQKQDDIKTVTSLVMRMLDLQFRIDRDTGVTKDSGEKTKVARAAGDTTNVSVQDINDLEAFLDTET